jgi:hypothetical protein
VSAPNLPDECLTQGMLRARATSKPIEVCPFGFSSSWRGGVQILAPVEAGALGFSFYRTKPASWSVIRPVRIRQISIKSRRATRLSSWWLTLKRSASHGYDRLFLERLVGSSQRRAPLLDRLILGLELHQAPSHLHQQHPDPRVTDFYD